MWFRTWSYVLVGLFLLQQLNVGADQPHKNVHKGKDDIFHFQKGVERLIEKILNIIEDFYTRIKNKYKCIPEEVPDKAMDILKRSIDCVEGMESKLQGRRITSNVHRVLFHKCLAEGKKEVQNLVNGIDPTVNHCPENMTEKVYQINVTTSFMKSFNINIKNGLEITKKTIYFGNHTMHEDDGADSEQNLDPDFKDESNKTVDYMEYYAEYEEENATEKGANLSSNVTDFHRITPEYESANKLIERRRRKRKSRKDNRMWSHDSRDYKIP